MPFPFIKKILLIRVLIVALPVFSAPESMGTTEHSGDGKKISAIVNGDIAAAFTQPWMVGLVVKARDSRPMSTLLTCGGVLIAPQWVLTAAHCVKGRNTNELAAVIGRENLDDSQGEVIDISEFIINAEWKDSGADADMALLRLADLSDATPLPVLPATLESAVSDMSLQVFGWGNTFDDDRVACELTLDDGGNNNAGFLCDTLAIEPENQPFALQQAAVQLQSLQHCYERTLQAIGIEGTAENRQEFDRLYNRSLCGWDPAETQAVCYGDSGGPLVATVDGKDYLVGVTSHLLLNGCRLENQITWFANPGKFRAYLDDAMARDVSLGLGSLCPGTVSPLVQYADVIDGRRPVTLSWLPAYGAMGYTLYFTSVLENSEFVGERKLSGDSTEFSAQLLAGDRYLVAMRAVSSYCDGPLSTTIELAAP